MKIARTPKHATVIIKPGKYISRFFFALPIVCCCLLSFSSMDITAQANASMAPVPEISTEDYPGPKWKSPVDYSAVLSSEQSNTATKLADPNLPANEFALYSGYQKMLIYMEEEINNQTTVDQIAFKGFNKVLIEAPGDPILQNMNTKDFQALYDALLPKLIK